MNYFQLVLCSLILFIYPLLLPTLYLRGDKMSTIYTDVGKKIRVYRKANNYTQEELGEILKIDQSYLGRIERGEINVTLETLFKIADALKISPSQLFEIRNERSKVRSDALEKIDALLHTLDTSDLQVIHRLLKEVLSLKRS